MSAHHKLAADDAAVEIDLRNPGWAAFLAWLWPGAGHLYQGRYAKGVLFMVCILGVYFFGLGLGGGRVVYASWTPQDHRWQYICQVGVGLPALPALVQTALGEPGNYPLGEMMAPPAPVRPTDRDKLASWHEKYGHFFELGALYTVIAGLLNLLAVYDAYAGPMAAVSEEETERPPPDDEKND